MQGATSTAAVEEKSPYTQDLFTHLCGIVNSLTPAVDNGNDKESDTGNQQNKLLLQAAQRAILDGKITISLYMQKNLTQSVCTDELDRV